MESLQSFYNAYEEYTLASKIYNDYHTFELDTAGLQCNGDPRFINIDIEFDGKDFYLYMKKISQKLSSKFIPLYQKEITYYPNPKYFRDKHIKKITAIQDALKLKFPKFDFFVSDIDDILEELNFHNHPENTQETNSTYNSNNNIHIPSIKWLAKTNILTTLFYDLMNGQDRNAPLIETTKKDIIDLILNNFVDSDGNQFSKNTIETNLRDSTPEKKAKRGDRIELGNVKIKSKL